MSAMTLTVLGVATPFPKPDEPCSGYLLQADDTSIWIDAGAGTLAELQRHVALADVDAIWISHLHPDHWADLLAAWNAYANDDTLPRPTVFGPPDWASRLDAALGQEGTAAKVFDMVQLDDRLKTTIGPIELQAFAMHHSVPTFGVRAEVNGRVLAYSADTGPCDALVELGQGADVLIVEAGADKPAEFHCTPEDVARATTTSAPRQSRPDASRPRFRGVDSCRPLSVREFAARRRCRRRTQVDCQKTLTSKRRSMSSRPSWRRCSWPRLSVTDVPRISSLPSSERLRKVINSKLGAFCKQHPQLVGNGSMKTIWTRGSPKRIEVTPSA